MIPIFISTNRNYIVPAIVLMYSTACNTKETLNFYILNKELKLHDEIYIKNAMRKCKNANIEFIKINENNFSKAPTRRHFTIETYYRFLIPELKPELEKVIYLDVDMVVDFDIAELYNIEIGQKPLAAVSEKCMDYMPEYVEHCSNLKVDNKQYFNAGMLIINLNYFRENNVFSKLMDKLNEFGDKLLCLDQDLLNLLFSDKYIPLDYSYNVLTGLKNLLKNNNDEDYKAFNNIKIYHFAGEMKPWNQECYFDYVWIKYAKRVVPLYMIFSKIFSVKTTFNHGIKRKNITIFGITIKIKENK